MLLDREHVLLDVVPHNVEVFHVIVGDGLAAKHNQVVRVHHVQTHKPNAAVGNRVQDDPRVPLDVQLLDARAVAARLITDGIDETATERAAVRTADGLVQRW